MTLRTVVLIQSLKLDRSLRIHCMEVGKNQRFELNANAMLSPNCPQIARKRKKDLELVGSKSFG